MPRATTEDIVGLLRANGATEAQAAEIVEALAQADLRPAQMRPWLDHPMRAYCVSVGAVVNGVEFKAVPTHAVEAGRADVVIAAAQAFAAATADERRLCRTFLCELDAVRRLTRGDPSRTAKLLRIGELLLGRLRKDIAVYEAIVTTLSGSFDDTTRLVDWMLDERLDQAVAALESGELDPIALRERGPLYVAAW